MSATGDRGRGAREGKRMKRFVVVATAVTLVAGVLALAPTGASAAKGSTRVTGRRMSVEFRGKTAPLRRLASFGTAPRGGHAEPWLGRHPGGDTEAASLFPVTGWTIPSTPNLPVSTTTTGLVKSWDALNHFDSRYANGGNQFSLEPPDQGLCVGNGFVMETVNDVLQVYNGSGRPLIHGNPGVSDLSVGLSINEFYGDPPSFDRVHNKFGPELFDVSCYYDQATGRWFHLADELDENHSTGAFTGAGEIDLAVSTSSDPLGAWRLYAIDTVNDGTGGTPNHHCDLGPCFADYPHIGADANGVYLTTNEYSFFGDGFSGAQLYALSKADLVAGAVSPRTVYFQNLTVPELGQRAFTLRAAQSRPTSFVSDNGGTEYFVSSTAGDGSETGNTTGGSDKIVVWGLTGSQTLAGSATPQLALEHDVVTTLPYVFPPLALQRQGPTPLLDCINQGVDCVGDPAPFVQKGPYPLDGADTRVMSSSFAGGVLWSTVATALKGSGGSDFSADNNYAPTPVNQKVGVLYFGLTPTWSRETLSATVRQQGYVGVGNANLIFPSLAMADGTTGLMGATIVGPGRYPAAAYIRFAIGSAPSIVRVAASGVGPDDGFTGTFEGEFEPRWGDYGYAVPGASGSVWFAAEYIHQRCSFNTFLADSTCGFTRSFFANWGTRITQVKP
jgi:hypothetical protein